jgi:hypothetical protein
VRQAAYSEGRAHASRCGLVVVIVIVIGGGIVIETRG